MAIQRVLTDFGMGTRLRRQDDTQAALRAKQRAPLQHSMHTAEFFGFQKEAMLILETGETAVVATAGVAAFCPIQQGKRTRC